tara:strand:+ start:446 stop:757 length:312 start_codon:yes stop_codon:yes gene_type:complete
MTDKNKDVTLLGINTEYRQEGDDVVRKHTQEISQAFLDDLKDSRNASKDQREGEYMRAASIPVAVHEQWLREGFDLYQATGPEIIKRLRDQNLDYFIATEKRI